MLQTWQRWHFFWKRKKESILHLKEKLLNGELEFHQYFRMSGISLIDELQILIEETITKRNTTYSNAGHDKYLSQSCGQTLQHEQVSDLKVSCQTRENILAEKDDRQLSVSVRAGEVQFRCSVNATMGISFNQILSVCNGTLSVGHVTFSVNQPSRSPVSH